MTGSSPCRGAIYARISHDKTGAGLGVERQEADCRELADRLGWPVAQVYVDNDTSAYSGKPRPAYRRMLDAIETGKVDAVLAWHTDRLHRSPVELEEYISACEARSVPTHCVKAGPLDLASPSGRMVARQLGAVARYESEHRAERVKAAHLQSARAGRRPGGPRPFGYEPDGITVREDEAALVRLAAERVLSGASLRSVAAEFNAAGVVTSMKGRPWTKNAAREVLLRPRNAGLRQYEGKVIGPAAWPPLLPEDQWRAVVALLTDESRRTSPADLRVKWLGSGLYRCGGCDRPSLRVSTSGRRVATYRCDGTGSGHVTRAAGPLDYYVQAMVVERLSRPDSIELLRPAAGAGADLDGLRATANAARARLTEIAEMLGDGELTRAEAQIARSRATERLETAESAIAAAAGPSPLVGVVDAPDPTAVWQRLDLDRRRAVLDALMTVTVLPIGRVGPGFNRSTVEITPREQQP